MLTPDRAISYLPNATVAPVTPKIRGVSSEVVLSVEDGMQDA